MDNVAAVLSASKEQQQLWMRSQSWFNDPEFEQEMYEALPFLDIFDVSLEADEDYLEYALENASPSRLKTLKCVADLRQQEIAEIQNALTTN
jgi:hypothetical protein